MTEAIVRKTYKLFIGGEFVRSESGRAVDVEHVNIPLGSRKDLRDAVRAARSAFDGWSGKTAYNRGQILYRIAEMLDNRRAEFGELLGGKKGSDEVDESVDTLIWYAGWCDKLHHVAGTVNPVAAPYFVFTLPEPTGVVGLVLPAEPPLLGAVRRIAPALCGGNTVVAQCNLQDSLPVLTLAEVLATSDVPKGVVNIISGKRSELLPWLASHMDVNAIDAGSCSREELRDISERAAENVKRVVKSDGALDLEAVTSLMEMKTVWHPIGA